MDVSEDVVGHLRRSVGDRRPVLSRLVQRPAAEPRIQPTAASYVRARIAEIVDDPETAAMLSPDTTIGCKRLVVDTDYFRTFNRSNVSLVDVGDTVEQITETAVVVDGVHHHVDDIVFATGFDAMTGCSTGSTSPAETVGPCATWSAGHDLGLQVAGFPNLFTVTGPGSPSVLTNMVVSIEQHVEYIRDVISSLDAEGLSTIEATEEAQAEWVAWVNRSPD